MSPFTMSPLLTPRTKDGVPKMPASRASKLSLVMSCRCRSLAMQLTIAVSSSFNAAVDDEASQGAPGAQYKTSTLSQPQAKECWQRLQEYLDAHKPYVQNELRIADVADMLEMPASKRKMLGTAARTRMAERYTLKAIVQEYSAVYEGLARKHKGAN